MLVDQEENPNQSRSFEGERHLIVGKELQEVSLEGVLPRCRSNLKASVSRRVKVMVPLLAEEVHEPNHLPSGRLRKNPNIFVI